MAADFFTWNNPNSIERSAIERFLSEASNRADLAPGRLPMRPQDAQLAINWLRGILDRKPSELRGDLT